MKGAGVGLYGRPRPVPLAPSLEEHAHIPSAGDHKGPLHIRSTTLAPTDRSASCLTSRLSLMLIGTQLAALRTHGLSVKSRLAGTFSLPVHATSDPQEIEAVDLVLFCVKTYDTRAASEGLHLLMGPETVVLPIQNGIDAAEQLGRQVGMLHFVGGVAYVTSQMESPGVIAQTAGSGSIELGELAGGQSERSRDGYTGTRIRTHLTDAGRRGDP